MDKKVLQNKVFISTRPIGKSGELSRILMEYGGEVLELPMIEIHSRLLTNKETKLLSGLQNVDWIIFTSANGVDYFFQHLSQMQGAHTLPQKIKIAVIGARTEQSLIKYGHSAYYVNQGTTSREFAEELLNVVTKEQNVLLPLGNLAGNTLENKLKNVASVFRINIYESRKTYNVNKSVLQKVLTENYSMVIFTSPSGVENFVGITKNNFNLHQLRALCIGNTTAGALKNYDVEPLIIASEASSKGIAQDILAYYQHK